VAYEDSLFSHKNDSPNRGRGAGRWLSRVIGVAATAAALTYIAPPTIHYLHEEDYRDGQSLVIGPPLKTLGDMILRMPGSRTRVTGKEAEVQANVAVGCQDVQFLATMPDAGEPDPSSTTEVIEKSEPTNRLCGTVVSRVIRIASPNANPGPDSRWSASIAVVAGHRGNDDTSTARSNTALVAIAVNAEQTALQDAAQAFQG
jgi:hypothetical protein